MSFALPDLDQETISELIASIHEALDDIEPALEELAEDPGRTDILNDLFRNLHTIKGNFRMCFLEPFTDYVHELEETISEVRKGRIHFSSTLKEAVLIGLDKLRDYMDLLQKEGACDPKDMELFGGYFKQLASSGPASVDQLAQDLFQLSSENTTDTDTDTDTITTNAEVGLGFFAATAAKLDQRLPGRAGRSEQMTAILQQILLQLDQPFDEEQLQAAIYLHDLGLGLPDGNNPQSERYQQHPLIAYQYLNQHPRWQLAAEIVLQHHEHLDGSGFPQSLRDEALLPEAKLFALICRFFDVMGELRDLPVKRAVIEALKDIHAYAFSRYDQKLVMLLTATARDYYSDNAA